MEEAIHPSGKPTEHSRSIDKPRAVQSLIFNWGELRHGDCQQDGGQIVFHSDGTGTFSCTTLTYHTHSGDTWGCSFIVNDVHNDAIFGTPYMASPRMSDGNPPPTYTWSAGFDFPAQLFNAIASVTQRYNC
jgi:hypothetical protein